MAVFSKKFQSKLEDWWDMYDIFIYAVAIVIAVIGITIFLCTVVIEIRADGGIIIDKFITNGSLYFMVMLDKDGKTEYIKVNVKPEKYYTTDIGEVYERK